VNDAKVIRQRPYRRLAVSPGEVAAAGPAFVTAGSLMDALHDRIIAHARFPTYLGVEA
jgi:hypothetical protein